MKKFKFRVWDKIKSRFLASNNNEGLRFDPNTPSKEGEDFGFQSLRLDFFIENEQNRYIVQQFTGLKDSKGVEIYEGDIVKGLFLDTDIHHWEEATAPVVWVDRVAGFNLSSDTWDRLSIEVVGNIFEK